MALKIGTFYTLDHLNDPHAIITPGGVASTLAEAQANQAGRLQRDQQVGAAYHHRIYEVNAGGDLILRSTYQS